MLYGFCQPKAATAKTYASEEGRARLHFGLPKLTGFDLDVTPVASSSGCSLYQNMVGQLALPR